MKFDLQTLILILGITHLMQVVVFYYQYQANKQVKGPGWWLLWSATEVMGFIFILLRNIPSLLPAMVLVQNIVLLLGTTFIYIGVLRFFERRVNIRLLIYLFSVFLVIHFYFIFIDNNIGIRSVNISFFLALISFITAYGIYRYKTSATSLTANFNAFIFLVHGCVFLLRSFLIAKGASDFDTFTPTLVNYLPYLDALVVSLMWTFGFIMMLNQKLNSEITETKTHFELIFKTSPDAVIISRLNDGLIVDCNEGFTRISGYSRDEFIGTTTITLPLWENPDDRIRMVHILKEQGVCENFELLFRRKNGQVVTGLLSARILKLKGEPHLLSVIRDISERKLAEEEIKLKNEQLKKLNVEKDKFFSIIAHDLRSPFGSFLSLTEMLTEQFHKLTLSRLQELILKLKNSAANLFQLLENLLEWSRMEQGSIPFRPVLSRLKPLIDDTISMMAESAQAKSIVIKTRIPAELIIFADQHFLLSVMRNLVSNAIKFTPRNGSIEVLAFKTERNVEIAIKDTGIGMSPELQENIFKIDARTSRKGTEGEQSSGLGLILCKSFIEKHNGSIWVESEEGRGTTFHFTLPNESI